MTYSLQFDKQYRDLGLFLQLHIAIRGDSTRHPQFQFHIPAHQRPTLGAGDVVSPPQSENSCSRKAVRRQTHIEYTLVRSSSFFPGAGAVGLAGTAIHPILLLVGGVAKEGELEASSFGLRTKESICSIIVR